MFFLFVVYNSLYIWYIRIVVHLYGFDEMQNLGCIFQTYFTSCGGPREWLEVPTCSCCLLGQLSAHQKRRLPPATPGLSNLVSLKVRLWLPRGVKVSEANDVSFLLTVVQPWVARASATHWFVPSQLPHISFWWHPCAIICSYGVCSPQNSSMREHTYSLQLPSVFSSRPWIRPTRSLSLVH